MALGFVEADGSCTTPRFSSRYWHGPISREGLVAVVGHSVGFVGSVSGTVWHLTSDPSGYVGEGWERTALFDWPGTQHTTWNFATTHPSLVGKPYSCARAAVVVSGGGIGGVGVDSLETNFLELKPAVAAAPSAQWLSPKEDQTVSGGSANPGSGRRSAKRSVTGPVVRTENYVDGQLNDTQVYCAVGVRVGHAQLRQRRTSAHGQGV